MRVTSSLSRLPAFVRPAFACLVDRYFWAAFIWAAYPFNAANATIRYDLSVTGNATGTGFIEFTADSFEVDGMFSVMDGLHDFEFTFDAVPASQALRSAPKVTFTRFDLTQTERLRYEVHDHSLIGLDLSAQAFFVSSDFNGFTIGISHLGNMTGAAHFDEGRFIYSSWTSTHDMQCDSLHGGCSATLQATLVPEIASPDFDADGDIDGRDFLLWQRNPSVGSLADWQASYGTGATAGSSSSAVPEPNQFTLVALAGLSLAVFRASRSVRSPDSVPSIRCS